MHCVRRDEHTKGYKKYKYFDPYFTVGIDLLHGKRTRRPLPTYSTFYVEVDKDKPEQRYKYRTFEKGTIIQLSLCKESIDINKAPVVMINF